MTGADTYLTRAIQGYLYFLFIHCFTLFEIILEITFGKFHDLGQITYLTQKTEDNIIVEDKKTNRQKAFLNEHENFK